MNNYNHNAISNQVSKCSVINTRIIHIQLNHDFMDKWFYSTISNYSRYKYKDKIHRKVCIPVLWIDGNLLQETTYQSLVQRDRTVYISTCTWPEHITGFFSNLLQKSRNMKHLINKNVIILKSYKTYSNKILCFKVISLVSKVQRVKPFIEGVI